MTPEFTAWAQRWFHPDVLPAALADLQGLTYALFPFAQVRYGADATPEQRVQQNVRLQLAREGHLVWRNNVGALPDELGRPIRFGLANDSKQVNQRVKSGDLIGIEKGTGRFLSYECKPEGWTYHGTDREIAQLRWIELVLSLGGRAAFTTGST